MSFSTVIRGAVLAVLSYFRGDWDLESIPEDPITEEVQRHVELVYRLSLCMLASFELGLWIGIDNYIILVGLPLYLAWYFFVDPPEEEWRSHKAITGALIGGCLVCTCSRSFLVFHLGLKAITGALLGTFGALVASDTVHVFFYSLANMLVYHPLALGSVSVLSAACQFLPLNPYIKMCITFLWCVVYLSVFVRFLVRRIQDGDVNYSHHAITIVTHAPAFYKHFKLLVFWELMDFLYEMYQHSFFDFLRRWVAIVIEYETNNETEADDLLEFV